MTCAHAVAYHRSIYDRILSEVPSSPAGMEDWLKTHHGIDQYYAFSLTDGKFLVSPVIATQPSILQMENENVRGRLLD